MSEETKKLYMKYCVYDEEPKKVIVNLLDKITELESQLQEKDKEIERLNNIINELDGMIRGDLDGFFTINNYGACNEIIEVLQNYKDKLKELEDK